ncbi:37S ribosomal protein S22 [Entomortierella beljakovae]|nr:37S ribosomal protein S22 [Entomortierella beljakovae]
MQSLLSEGMPDLEKFGQILRDHLPQAILESMISGKSTFKLPNNLKMAKLDTIEEYDPNMVIFLDKLGNVSMIPHDDRVNGQTRDEYDTSLASQVVDESENPHHQRGSKEMEYGRKRIGQVDIPLGIQDAIRSILEGSDKALIRTDALRLYGSLRSTGSLDGHETFNNSVKKLQSGSKSSEPKGDKPVPAHILEYGQRESTAYIAAMAPATYSAITNVLTEVDKRVPDLQIKSFMDFGTGPGTGIWAANELWKTPIQYTGIDSSLDMLETAEEILGHLSTNGNGIPNVTLKSFVTHGSLATKFDVVLSAFTLSEITAPELRKSTLENLWESTNDILILIDRGTPSGFKALAEAREQILGLDMDRIKIKPKFDDFGNILPAEEPPKREPAHVLAPCPHDNVCPIYASLSRDSQWCHFSQKVQRPDFLRKTKHSKENYEDSKYSYVVLRKGARPVHIPLSIPKTKTSPQITPVESTAEESVEKPQGKKKFKKPPPPPPVTYDNPEDMFAASHAWSRIVVPPLKKDGHVVMDTCASNGYLERIIIPKSQGKIPYRDARKAMWGDLFPHAPKNNPVRKDSVMNEVAEGDDQEMSNNKMRRPAGISPQALAKRLKHKEKKQNRQKVSHEEIEGGSKNRKRRKDDDEDLAVQF